MQNFEILQPGKFYHVYNCGINGEDLFRNNADFERFLRLFEKYIMPVCETYAWVLMKNHFHFLVRIKENIGYKYSMNDFGDDKEKFNELKWETTNIVLTCQHPEDLKVIKPTPHLHFSHLFNAYAKYFNIKYKRHGSLFERPFHRKKIDNKKYFKNVIVYIHQNPVHHGFCDYPDEWGWSSYLTVISIKPTQLDREEVIGWFDNVGNFKDCHNNIIDRLEFERYLGL